LKRNADGNPRPRKRKKLCDEPVIRALPELPKSFSKRSTPVESLSQKPMLPPPPKRTSSKLPEKLEEDNIEISDGNLTSQDTFHESPDDSNALAYVSEFINNDNQNIFLSDDESPLKKKKKKKKKPEWIQRRALRAALRKQNGVDPDSIFGRFEVKTCDLTKVFENQFTPGDKKGQFQKRIEKLQRMRSASGDWKSDRLQEEEEREYKRRMGWMD